VVFMMKLGLISKLRACKKISVTTIGSSAMGGEANYAISQL